MDKIHVLSKWNRLLDLSPNYHIYDTHESRIDHKKSSHAPRDNNILSLSNP